MTHMIIMVLPPLREFLALISLSVCDKPILERTSVRMRVR
jgi:hypothetical protein